MKGESKRETMKDFRLSEIVEHCKKMYEDELNRAGVGFAIMSAVCRLCGERNAELYDFCEMAFRIHPLQWNVGFTPRDMIELPCIEHRNVKNNEVWDVYYRTCCGDIAHELFFKKANADEFLGKVKKEQV